MRRLAGLGSALVLAACAGHIAPLPKAPVAAGSNIRVVAKPVDENAPGYANVCTDSYPKARNAPIRRCDRWRFAGGLDLASPDTARLHGLSDLEVLADGRLTAVTDEGDLVRGRVVLDASGRLTNVADMSLTPLAGLDGRPLSGAKTDSDAEGLAIRPDGGLMVSFEADHRVWLYPAAGGPPRRAPSPAAPFPANDGMEALALAPQAGRDAYLVGREDTRETWTCRLAGGCAPSFKVPGAKDAALVAARPLPGGRWAFLLRAFGTLTGPRIWIVVTDRGGAEIDNLEIKRPATVDNFEGLSVQTRKDGTVRLYLLSDDNFSNLQRTLLFAYDWTPPGPR